MPALESGQKLSLNLGLTSLHHQWYLANRKQQVCKQASS